MVARKCQTVNLSNAHSDCLVVKLLYQANAHSFVNVNLCVETGEMEPSLSIICIIVISRIFFACLSRWQIANHLCSHHKLLFGLTIHSNSITTPKQGRNVSLLS